MHARTYLTLDVEFYLLCRLFADAHLALGRQLWTSFSSYLVRR